MLWNENECGNTKVMRISRQPFAVRIMVDQKQLEDVKYFNYLGSMLINDAICTEIKSNFSMEKGAFNKKKALFTESWTKISGRSY
jgi:predicted acetyltransferase